MKIGCQMEKSGKTGVWWYRAFVGKTRYGILPLLLIAGKIR